ncbi:uncharacterized protein LOC122690728 isoform X4 [Cervus elaphus]|uniref:uncharacterized protein LOC122690728 isoform X4 n=1 Tax=Cervus elaphus TaxID=9860 RepID=UPI001CC28304|nr:uncharacterized protein LOC122690728 isoform X4 [Cervus elaphus]
MKTQVPWPLQRAQHMVAKVCQVVLVAAMALATQLALEMPSVEESLPAPATWLIPETPALPESQVAQPLPFRRSRGHPTDQGLVETQHPEPEFTFGVPFSSRAEADNARHILTRRTQLRWPVQRQLYVNGRMLVLRLTAEDHALLQMAVDFCLEQISLVMWTLQNFVPRLFPQSQHRRMP